MKENYKEIYKEVESGKPYKLMLNDQGAITFDKQKRNHYKVTFIDSFGSKRETIDLNESGLIAMFEKFSEKATHINKIVH